MSAWFDKLEQSSGRKWPPRCIAWPLTRALDSLIYYGQLILLNITWPLLYMFRSNLLCLRFLIRAHSVFILIISGASHRLIYWLGILIGWYLTILEKQHWTITIPVGRLIIVILLGVLKNFSLFFLLFHFKFCLKY